MMHSHVDNTLLNLYLSGRLTVWIQKKRTRMVSSQPSSVVILTVSNWLDSCFDPLDDLGDTYNYVEYDGASSPQPVAASAIASTSSGTTPVPDGFIPTVQSTSATEGGAFVKHYHPQRPGTHGRGLNLLQELDCDQHAFTRRTSNNYYYPFADDTEWEMVQWMTRSSLTQQDIDAFLKLKYVSRQPLYRIFWLLKYLKGSK